MGELTTYKPQSAIAIRRQMAGNPVVMRVLEPVEKSVFLASTAKPISDYEDQDLAMDLRKALILVAKDVGYRSTSEADMAYLVVRVAEILKRYYRVLTMRDFRMAFEMSITGELDEYLPKGRDGMADRGHYQQFNAEYVCKILNAYKFKRAAVLKKANDALPVDEVHADAKLVADLMVRQKQIFLEVLDNYRANGRFPDGMTPITEIICCDVLSACGMMPPVVVTAEEQKAIFQRTLNHYARIGNMWDLERLKQAGPGADELQQKAFTLSRRKALQSTIERIINEGVDIAQYIKID